MPVVASEGRFKRPVRYPAFIKANVSVEKLSTSSITFRVSFYSNGEEVAYTKLTFVCIDTDWKKRALPEEIQKLGDAP